MSGPVRFQIINRRNVLGEVFVLDPKYIFIGGRRKGLRCVKAPRRKVAK